MKHHPGYKIYNTLSPSRELIKTKLENFLHNQSGGRDFSVLNHKKRKQNQLSTQCGMNPVFIVN